MRSDYRGINFHPAWRGRENGFAFETAQERGRKKAKPGKMCVVTKSNTQIHGLRLWGEVAGVVFKNFLDVEWERMLVDAMTVRMTLHPETLDTMVATNLHAFGGCSSR